MKINKITIGRLYNLGNYEHVRYELTCEVPADGNSETAIIGMERILSAMKPLKLLNLKSAAELQRLAQEVESMKTMPAVEWERRYGHCIGTPTEVVERYQKSLEEETVKTHTATERAKKSRQMFDDLGGASQWKDAKLDWDDYSDDWDDQ